MPLLSPRMMIGRMIDLTPELLRSLGISALLLDVDNTMTTHDNPVPAPGVAEWIAAMKREGFALVIVSNNSEARVSPFAGLVGLPFVSKGRKPLATGCRKACRMLGVEPCRTAVVGDQIYTDILGGNLLGAYTILTEPYQPEDAAFFRFKRCMERPVIGGFRRRERLRNAKRR